MGKDWLGCVRVGGGAETELEMMAVVVVVVHWVVTYVCIRPFLCFFYLRSALRSALLAVECWL